MKNYLINIYIYIILNMGRMYGREEKVRAKVLYLTKEKLLDG